MESAELLAALSLQIAWGVDEALEDLPCDRTIPRAEPLRPEPARPTPPGRPFDTPPARPEPARQTPPRPALVVPGPGGVAAPPAAARAAALAAAADSLDALRAAIAGFDGSSLRETATNMVFADGVPGASLMFVGEAPGGEEDRLGRPFVGQSGQLLDRMLASIGVSRDRDFYITNILPFRPPGNRTPSDAEIALFMPFLLRHVALARPRILVMLGGVSAKSLLRAKDGITRLRGRWHEVTADDWAGPGLATLHPAYLLRTPGAKRDAWADLLLLRRRLDSLG